VEALQATEQIALHAIERNLGVHKSVERDRERESDHIVPLSCCFGCSQGADVDICGDHVGRQAMAPQQLAEIGHHTSTSTAKKVVRQSSMVMLIEEGSGYPISTQVVGCLERMKS
jgi:hypothetical protein